MLGKLTLLPQPFRNKEGRVLNTFHYLNFGTISPKVYSYKKLHFIHQEYRRIGINNVDIFVADALLWGMRKRFSRDVEDGYYQPVRLPSNQTIAALLSVTCITLFVFFHITLYDATVYQIQTQQFSLVANGQDFIPLNNRTSSTYTSSLSLFRNNFTIDPTAKNSYAPVPKMRQRLPQVSWLSRTDNYTVFVYCSFASFA
jgi:hypothetical protein